MPAGRGSGKSKRRAPKRRRTFSNCCAVCEKWGDVEARDVIEAWNLFALSGWVLDEDGLAVCPVCADAS